MKAAATAAVGFWVGVILLLSIAWLINGCDRMPENCELVNTGPAMVMKCTEAVSPFWRIKRIKCKGKEGNHCHTFWTIGPQPTHLDEG